MIEPIMFLGLGFLAASLLALILLPLVHARAVRLTRRRIEALAPLSVAELKADKDQLRAEFAMSTRRLEMVVEQLKERSTEQLAELGKKTAAINALKAELDERDATIASFEMGENSRSELIKAAQQELADSKAALRAAEEKLAEFDAQIGKLGADLEDRSMTADSQRVQIIALETQVATLRDKVGDLEQQAKEADLALQRERSELETTRQLVASEREKTRSLGERIGELQQQLSTQASDSEGQRLRLAEIEPLAAERERRLAVVTRERDQFYADLTAARRIEADLRDRLAALDAGHTSETAAKALLDGQRGRSGPKQGSATSDQQENALLRERINEVAAEVAHLTLALEGPGSPIDAILAHQPDAQVVAGAARNGSASSSTKSGSNLADRIRALKARAPRPASTS